MAELDARRIEVLGTSASVIQRKVRSHLARQRFVSLQRTFVRQIYESLRREAACLRIQKNLRMCVARKTYKELLASSITIQSGLRGMAARKDLLLKRQTRAAIIIQNQCRQYLARLHYMRLKRAAISTQCAWRRRVAIKELRKLKMAAKETGALQAAKNKLEKQVEELTWRLQLEKRMRADMEEAKTQENAKLQSALQEMQLQFKEAKAALMKEREEFNSEADKQANLAIDLPDGEVREVPE
ncbi:hypothetical protein QJS10_CPA09g01892 [Acorus calamus]|uniref:Uncharacterized protein n=1 Tax=Acorus calamus TaxID=4465 RepID=A0AAV9E6S1_ACOCL|nr:hypothetical protein QJS10_CPA09g01892 [Acorus calamus]